MTLRRWLIDKERYLSRLRNEISKGKVDEDIIDILNAINSIRDLYTTSSCSGRIQVAEVEYPWEKWNYKILGKWHRPVSVDEVLEALRKGKGNVWLKVQPPMIHIAARTLTTALRVLEIARNSGFKHSGIQGIREDRVIVEILSLDKIEFPIMIKGRIIVKEGELEGIVHLCNKILLKGKSRLIRFKRELIKAFKGG